MKNMLLEEIFNSITHGIGVVLGIIGLVILFIVANKAHNIWEIAGFSIFGATLILMFLMSTLFHSLYFTKARKIFAVFDQSSIFLLIAGTYTPFALTVFRGQGGYIILFLIWLIALTGIVLKSIFREKFKIMIVVIYLLLGWISIIFINPLTHQLSFTQKCLLVLGGLFYSIGVVFYAWKKLPFNHTIWHLFVIAGATCHFITSFAACNLLK